MYDSLDCGYRAMAPVTEVDDLCEFELDMSRFQKLKKLGDGGFSSVYLARDLYTQWTVVVKEMHQSLQISERDLEFFKREISILVRSRDPFVLQCYGFSREMPCSIVTAYMKAGSLWDIVHSSRGNLLNPTQKNNIALGIAHGMRYLHSCNIVHRDLKSPNILLDERGLPKIADFGLSRFMDCEGAPMTGCIGTTQWMAPEQISGVYGPPVDVFAYGMILYEMLTGMIPYEEQQDQGGLFVAITDGYRPPLNPIGDIERLILQCWDQDPERRPTFEQIYALFASGTIKFKGSSRAGARQFMRIAQYGGQDGCLDPMLELARQTNGVYKTAEITQGRIKDIPNLLCYYAEHGSVRDLCRVMCSVSGADINSTSGDGRTPLFCAAYFGRTHAVELLVAINGIDVNKPDRNGHTPLMAAACSGHVPAMAALLESPDINVNAVDNEGRTALHIAALAGMDDVIAWLLKEVPSVMILPDKNGKTPADLAMESGFPEIASLFV